MAPLVPVIARELALSHGVMGGVLGAWPLVYIASAVPCGLVLERLGVRWSMALAAAIIAVSGVSRAIATDGPSLFLAVALFGLGGPLVSIGVPKLVGLWFEGSERALAMGVCFTAPAGGGIAALALTNSVAMPLAGGRWRVVLAVYAVFVLAVGAGWLVVTARTLEPARGSRDATGARVTPRAQLLVFADLLRVPAVRIVLSMSVGIFFFNHGFNNWLPEILTSGGMEVAAAGYWASVPAAVGIAGALVVPRLALPSRRIAMLALLFAAGGAAALLIERATGSLLTLGLVLQGIARGSMIAVALLALIDVRAVGTRNIAAAGGLFFSAAEIGGVLGPLAIGTLYDWTGGFAAGLRLQAAVCGALLLLLALFRRATDHHPALSQAA